MTKTQYCFVLKSGVPNPKIHKVKTGPVRWSDGRTEDHILPACGTRIDVCALETEWAYGISGMGHAGDPCGKCFPVETDIDPDNSVFAKAITVRCPKCRQGPGNGCCYPSGAGMQDRFHKARMIKAKETT